MVNQQTMAVSLTSNEEAQLAQTIEMFEVITQSQPLDYQSLEILKEAYSKLEKPEDAVRISKRIAQTYLSLGQLSSAILEYESILQRFPDDPDVKRALDDIESKANSFGSAVAAEIEEKQPPRLAPAPARRKPEKHAHVGPVEDGRQAMQKLFVDGKFMSLADFDRHWPVVDLNDTPKHPLEPFIKVLADHQILPLETSLKLLMDKSRLCYLPVERYEVDVDLARTFPRELCQRWCVLPFDRMSKSLLLATANPFNKQVVLELQNFFDSRLLWYIASPHELLKMLRKVFR